LARDLTDLDVCVLMIDGVHFADDLLVVAMVITTDGTKIPVGLVHGDTENATIVKALLADLVARGLNVAAGILVVIDGAKALRLAVKSVFGEHAVVQRCTIHKRRNVTGYLPTVKRGPVDRRLAQIFAETKPVDGKRKAELLAKELELAHPDAAASLREGLDEMFTVATIGASPLLRKSLSTSNAIESMISIARTTTSNVKNWKDGSMAKRWCAVGMLEAERSFRKLRGHTDLKAFTHNLRAHITPETVTPTSYTQNVA
jgi:putative transposase